MRTVVSLLLATLAAPSCQDRASPWAVARDQDLVQTARMQLGELQVVLDYYKIKKGIAPETWTPLITRDSAGVRALECVEAPRDPWGHEYRLVLAEGRRTVVLSAGPDGKFGTEDDLYSPRGDPVRSLSKLHDLEGKWFDRSAYRGRLVVLHFWSMKCPHESQVQPKLKELAREFEADVAVLAIAVNSDEIGEPPPHAAFGLPDPAQRPYAVLREHVQRERLGHPVLVDHTGDTPRVFGATKASHCFVLDRRGRIAYSGALEEGGPQDGREHRQCFVRDAVEALLRNERPAREKGPEPDGTPLRPKGAATPGK